MRETEFKAWLSKRLYKGKPLTTVGNRAGWVKAAERALPELGFTVSTLDDVFADGHWDAALKAFSDLRANWKVNEAAARKIAPQSVDPHLQVANTRQAVGVYGRFLRAEDPNYDEPDEASPPTSAKHPFLLFDATGAAFQPVCHGERDGRSLYKVKPPGSSNRADEAMAFDNLAEVARAMLVDGLSARVQSIHKGPVNYLGYGKQKLVRYELDPKIAVEIGVPSTGQIGRTDSPMTDEEFLARFTAKPAFANWWASWGDADRAAFFRFVRQTHDAGLDWYHVNLGGQIRCGRKNKRAIDATEVFALITQSAPRCWVSKSGDREALGVPDDFVALEAFANALYTTPDPLERFRTDRAGYWPDEVNPDQDSDDKELVLTPDIPTNLILYGPPGTGKTYATAAKAVELCGEAVPAQRTELMTAYHALQAKRRIAFITFHQNYSYEEFVEGLRPETGGDEASSAGFRLEPRSGIFREICALAEQAQTRRGAKQGAGDVDLSGRRFWKMGQGAISSEDDVYEEALANNYIALGWGGTIDWSDDRFLTFDAIKAEWLLQHPDNKILSNWTQMWPFRCEMKPGDVVIVPYGNSAFRAVAEVTGDYYYVESAEGYYAHRRPVRWLLKLDEPLPLDMIVDGKFTMRTLYPLTKKRVNVSALSGLLPGEEQGESAGDPGTPDQFVLIIDEINRANISKVFGELITLLEPDKRLGMPNALTVVLPYSKKRDFGVPANLHIIGTMNTADRSIALLDTALRRRFDFQELMPQPELLKVVDGIDLSRLLKMINERIEYLFDREHQIGHAFLFGCASRADIDAVMRRKVLPLLSEYFYEDWSKVALVLGDDGTGSNGFLERRELAAPPGLEAEYETTARYRWSVRDKFEYGAFAAA